MNPQIAYNLLVSASNYVMAVHGDYEAYGVLGDARSAFCMSTDMHNKFYVSHESSAANMERWLYIRSLQGRAA